MRRYSFFSILVVLTSLLVSCGPFGTNTPAPITTPTPEPGITIDPIFREYYDQLGGINTLGRGISKKFTYEGLECQLTQAGLMVYDKQAPERSRRYLAPIGVKLNVYQPPVPVPEDPDALYVEGHVIYEKFAPLYSHIGGELTTGKPLSELHYDPDMHRFEQFFENLGFYISEDDPENRVRLLSYGSYLCTGGNCLKFEPDPGSVTPMSPPAPGFSEVVSRLGATFTGFALSDAYLTPDNYLEQVFENVVVVSVPDQPGEVCLRDVPERLGWQPEPLSAPSPDPTMHFYPIGGGDKGHNIPNVFMDYLAQHGGLEVSGPPISEYHLLTDNVYRQCFQNLCLEENLLGPDYLHIQPSKLGYKYKKMGVTSSDLSGCDQDTPESNNAAPSNPVLPESIDATAYPQQVAPAAQSSTGASPSGQVSIQVWETFPMIAPAQSQEIGVSVSEDGSPLIGIQPDLLVKLPDGSTPTYPMEPTGEFGQAYITLEPINAPSGTLIPYEVCISLTDGQRICIQDSFTIWY